jgi:hypothetical protein
MASGKPKTRHRTTCSQQQQDGCRHCRSIKYTWIRTLVGLIYSGWFAVYPLVKNDIIFTKDWMDEISHHVNHEKNRLCLGGNGDGCRLKFTIHALRKDEGRVTQLMTMKSQPTRPQS